MALGDGCLVEIACIVSTYVGVFKLTKERIDFKNGICIRGYKWAIWEHKDIHGKLCTNITINVAVGL